MKETDRTSEEFVVVESGVGPDQPRGQDGVLETNY